MISSSETYLVAPSIFPDARYSGAMTSPVFRAVQRARQDRSVSFIVQATTAPAQMPLT